MAEGAGAPATSGAPQPGSTDPTTTTTTRPTQTTPPTSAPTEPGAETSDDEEVRDPKALLRTYKQLQEQSKAQRAELKRLQDAAKAAEDAKLSESERLTKRVAELEAADKARAQALLERTLAYEIKLQAAGLSIVDPDAAAKLVDLSAIEFDAAGTPQGVDKALKALIKDKPWLIAAGAAPGATGQQPAAGTANPATRSSSATSTRRYSAADLEDTDFYRANRDDIIRAHREGRIDP